MRIPEVARVGTMEHICVHSAAHLLEEVCCHCVSIPVSERTQLLWPAIQVACHRGPWGLLVGHSDSPLTLSDPVTIVFCKKGQHASEMQARVPWKNSEDMIIYVGEANKAKVEVE